MKTVLVYLDHGLGVGYFFQTGLAEKLAASGVRLVFLLQEAELERRRQQPAADNIVFESMREKECIQYQKTYHAGMQELFEHVRRTITSTKIPLDYVEVRQRHKIYEAKGRRKVVLKILRPFISLLRRTRLGRALFLKLQCALFTPDLYGDLFDQYEPVLVISDSAGWRLDQYLLREANRRKIKTATVIVGWDNPGSTGMPGAAVEYVNVWSEIHKWEMSEGVDWDPRKILIGGMPLYDGYINKAWLLPRQEYFARHGLDPRKKVIAFAATALSATPNLPTIKLLAEIVHNQKLKQPAQLLVRLHPTHFKNTPAFKREAEQIFQLANEYRDVHVVEPKASAEGLERYSGEDFPEKASMLAYSDVLVTFYSTMVVEGALHDTPCLNVVIPSERGWEDKFWVPMQELGSWPTPVRIESAGAAKRAASVEELIQGLDDYIQDPSIDHAGRMEFIRRELTFLDGSATERTAQNLLKIIAECE